MSGAVWFESGRGDLTFLAPMTDRFGLCWRDVPDRPQQTLVVETVHPVQRVPFHSCTFGQERRANEILKLASLRISLALRSALFSRSSALRRCKSVVVKPALAPVSISSRLTHSLSVWGIQPILGAIDSMAARSEGYSPRCSCTRRTARSRTSGENLFYFLFRAQSSQRKEPPQNPGRFQALTTKLSRRETAPRLSGRLQRLVGHSY